MAILANHYVLAVADDVKSGDFFVRCLGFEVTLTGEGWTFVNRDNCMIMIGRCPGERPAAELGNHSYFGYLVVDDVDQIYQQVTASGHKPMSAPSDKPWRMREFGIQTPDGHRLMIGQRLSA